MTVAGGPALRVAEWPRQALIVLCSAMAILAALAIARVPSPDATLLAVVVGGIHAVAAVLLVKRHRHGAEVAAVGGGLMFGWVVTEAIVLRMLTIPQAMPMLLGALTAGLGVYLATRPLEAPSWRRFQASATARR